MRQAIHGLELSPLDIPDVFRHEGQKGVADRERRSRRRDCSHDRRGLWHPGNRVWSRLPGSVWSLLIPVTGSGRMLQ